MISLGLTKLVNNLLSLVLAQITDFFSKMLTVVFVPTVSLFCHICLEDQGIDFFNGFWCCLLPVKSIFLDDPIQVWVLPFRCRWPDDPCIQTVVFQIHQLHRIQSGPHNSSGEFLCCPSYFCGILPVDCRDNVTLSKLRHEINPVALEKKAYNGWQ